MSSEPPPEDARLLFCPFCRECYEGESECPVHELTLVEFTDLPKQAHERQLPGWEEELDPWDLRFGRGIVALGAMVTLVGFFLPFASGIFDDEHVSWNGLDLALGPARVLWTVPFVAAMFVYFLLRRRTPLMMLGSRLVAVVLSFMPAVSAGYSMWAMENGVARLHGGGVLSFGVGPWAIFIGCAILFVGSLRFGAMPVDALPHGAEPETDEQRPSIDTGEDGERARPRRKRRRRR